MLDFTASSAELGKPGQGADLKLGLATAPALYAWEEFPELGAMIERKFGGEHDVEQVRFAPRPTTADPCRRAISSRGRRGRHARSSWRRRMPRRPGTC